MGGKSGSCGPLLLRLLLLPGSASKLLLRLPTPPPLPPLPLPAAALWALPGDKKSPSEPAHELRRRVDAGDESTAGGRRGDPRGSSRPRGDAGSLPEARPPPRLLLSPPTTDDATAGDAP